ncbi:FecR family protein [Mariniphaga sediminis]|uniref:FecR family protein n=1 Tax=Mariniphaga sediminis TaxID=1628158 RepID=UPI0035697151
MNVPKDIVEIINRLYSNQYLGSEEIRNLEKWLKQSRDNQDTEQWLFSNWQQAENVNFDISIENIFERIKQYEKQSKSYRIKVLLKQAQKIAAVLAIPLLILSVWLLVNPRYKSSEMVLATAKGEHSHVFLPDGSEVWLNVDSRLEYTTDFNATNRHLKLSGEAFFKVAKKQKYPFIVETPDFNVKAIGTEFNVITYREAPYASTFLKEGAVELVYFPHSGKEQKVRMRPGEKASLNKKENTIVITNTLPQHEIGWLEGELMFENEPMDLVFEKTERWYDVRLEFNPDDFEGESLNVKLKKNESIQRLFEIIDEAMGIHVKQNGNDYVIRRK